MQLKVIEVVAPKGHADTLIAIAEQYKAADWQVYDLRGDEQECVRILTAQMHRQPLVDRIHTVLSGSDHWRLAILPADGTLPEVKLDEEEAKAESARSVTATREEVYSSVSAGTKLDPAFLLLVVLSTLVAGIGLISDNVAVVVGAMLIAPLLGPNLALAFAAALGDRALMARAVRTGLIGFALAILLPAAFALLTPVALDSDELRLRTAVGYDGIALALAAGTAAALSLTAGLSTTLVGVMVAAALLPPAATTGLMLGAARTDAALGAATLLAVNIISINLAAQIVFLVKGIKPHRWFEQKEAQQSFNLTIVVWAILLAAVALIIATSPPRP